MKVNNLNEMSFITDDHVGISRQVDFENSFKKLKLVSDSVELLGNKIYEDYFIFYLTDKDDKYLGHVEYDFLDNDKTQIAITTTYAIKNGIGLYEFMFQTILAKTDIKMIFGGDHQSKRAIGSWKKQLAKFKKKVYNTETKQIENFDDSKENEYWTQNKDISKKYLVGISESENYIKREFNHAKDFIEKLYRRGRIVKPNNSVLVMFYGFNNNEAESLIETCQMTEFNVFEEGFVREIDESNTRLLSN